MLQVLLMCIPLIILLFITIFHRCTTYTNTSAFFRWFHKEWKRSWCALSYCSSFCLPSTLSMDLSGPIRWEISLHYMEGTETLPIPAGKAVITHSGHTRFKYQPTNRISCKRFRWFSSVNPRNCYDCISVKLNLFFQDSLQFAQLPLQSYYHSTLYGGGY
jgi:hypothetical protein